MASNKQLASTALFLTLNLLFFTMVSSQCSIAPPPPKSSSPEPRPKPTPPSPKPNPKNPSPSPKPASKGKCPKDTLKFGVCANVLKNLVTVVFGKPPKTPCCSLIKGLVDLEAAVCVCTALKTNILGINLNVPVSLTLLLNFCGKKVPSGFQCA